METSVVIVRALENHISLKIIADLVFCSCLSSCLSSHYKCIDLFFSNRLSMALKLNAGWPQNKSFGLCAQFKIIFTKANAKIKTLTNCTDFSRLKSKSIHSSVLIMVLYGILFSRMPVSKVDVVLHAEKCHVEKKS